MPDSPRIEDLRRRVQKDPASIVFAQLAEEYRRAGQYAEAVDACRSGLERHPGYLSARVTLGRALIELGHLDEARHELEQVLKSAPENLAAIRGLAEIHHKRGALPEALAQYKAALTLAPNDPELAQTIADLTRKVAPQKRVEPEDGLSFAHLEEALAAHAPVPVASAPPVEAPPDAHKETVPFDVSALPPPIEFPDVAGEPGADAPSLFAAIEQQAAQRAAHQIAVLERWLAVIHSHHVARANRRP